MLEVRYIKATKEVTGWCGDSRQFGRLDRKRDTEAIVILDIPIPPKSCSAYLFNEATSELIANPDYIESQPPRDLHAEVDEIKARLAALEPKEM